MKLETVTALFLSASCFVTSIGFGQVLDTKDRSAASEKTPTVSSPNEQKRVGDVQSTPEVALKKFMIAMISGDLKQLKSVTHPIKDIELLLPTAPIPEKAVEQIKVMFQAMPITALKVGDTVKLPGGGSSITFDESHINEDKVMLTFPNNPVPFPAARIDGVWKINPESILLVRKTANKLREKQQNGLDAKPNSDLQQN